MTEKEKSLRDTEAAKHSKIEGAQKDFKAGWNSLYKLNEEGNPWAKDFKSCEQVSGEEAECKHL